MLLTKQRRQPMKTQNSHFRVSSNTKDRIKIPGVFWAGLKAIGVSPQAVLQRSHLPTTVYTGESFVTTPQNFAIWRAIGDLTNDPTVGWKFMSLVETQHYHPTLLAALHARTYRESIERLARYKQLCSVEEFRITTKDDEVRIEVSWPFAGGESAPPLLIDVIFTLVTELGRRGTKTNFQPKRVELTRTSEPKDGLPTYFGCAVKYRAMRDALVLRASDLELPFVVQNDELLQMLTPQFENQLKDRRAKLSTVDQVKSVLKRLLSGSRPDVVMVAKELGMSERSLQRHITDEGTTFRQLLVETRRELVREYLNNDSVEITEAAFLVGYEDPNSFYRAFRSWEGQTPAEWRAANQSRRPNRN
jgi:AraC-like DNA-binding protein